MKYKWLIKELKDISKDFLSASFNSGIIAKLLLNRGINTPEAAKSYLDPNFYKESKPEEIPDLLCARDRIIEAINKKEKITIFGDYDVDGVTSTSCLLIALKQFTDNLDFYIPSRLTEGYGLNKEAVKTIASRGVACNALTKLLITCDCGITNSSEIELANGLGMDVIVTDHHSLPEILPPAYAILNPKMLPPDHKLHFLPGVGVAYKLAESVIAAFPCNDVKADDLLDLVTLGMIADLAPLVDENRYLVQTGLPRLAATEKVGLQELLRMCGCLENKTARRPAPTRVERGERNSETAKGNSPTTEHIGFGIAPRINAVGRLTDASLAVKLFTTDNLLEAVQIAAELDAQNKERQLICEETLSEAVTLVSEQVDLENDKCIVLAKEGWHHGVIGIVASRVLEKYHLPTILIGVDKEQNIARGSGRSIGALDITEALGLTSKHLERFGGHKAACGLSLKPDNINNFIFDFKETVNNKLNNADLGPVLKIDLELPISNVNLDLMNKINKLSPFGFGNPMPTFASEEVEIAGVRNIGKNGQHLKLTLNVIARKDKVLTKQSPNVYRNEIASSVLTEPSRNDVKMFEALIWNHDSKTDFKVGEKIKIAYTPKLNNFNGETSIQLEVKDWELVERYGPLRPRSEASDTAIRRYGEGQVIELYDYRGRTQECINLFPSEHVTFENLVLLESPPDENTFIDIVKSSCANKIYFAFSESSRQRRGSPKAAILNPESLLKKLIGMLKYIKNNKSSQVKEIDLMSALGLNKTTLAYALETLVKIGFLTYKRNGEELSINILVPNRQNFNELIEYKLFASELKQILEFKQFLYSADLSEIEGILERNNIESLIVSKERMKV